MFPFILTEDGYVSKLTFYASASIGVYIKACISAADGGSGEPGTLKGVSQAVAIGNTLAEYEFVFSSSIFLEAGVYYLGFISGGSTFNVHYGTASGVKYRYDLAQNYSTPINWRNANDNHLDGYTMAVYATYEPKHSGTGAISGNGAVAGTVQKGGKGSVTISALGTLVGLGVAGILGLAAISGAPGHQIASGGTKGGRGTALLSADGINAAMATKDTLGSAFILGKCSLIVSGIAWWYDQSKRQIKRRSPIGGGRSIRPIRHRRNYP